VIVRWEKNWSIVHILHVCNYNNAQLHRQQIKKIIHTQMIQYKPHNLQMNNWELTVIYCDMMPAGQNNRDQNFRNGATYVRNA
jgi:hypothetical protein